MTDEQLGDRHREVADERRVNQVAEVDDAADTITVHQGVHAADVVVDHLRALLLEPGEHVCGEVVEDLLDDATPRGILDVVRSRYCSSWPR